MKISHRPMILAICVLIAPVGEMLLAATPVQQVSAAEKILRQNVAWQIALDRVGYSPGLIDGMIGPKTKRSTSEFQRVRGLAVTGELDAKTTEALEVDPDNCFVRYTVTSADLAEIGAVPTSWRAKSKLERLGHASLDWVIAEKMHCKRSLLEKLNRGVNINALEPGKKLIVPNVQPTLLYPQAAQLEVDLTDKVVRVIDDEKRLVAMFYCSVAKNKAKLPTRDARVQVIVPDPNYRFDPKMYPEVKEEIDKPLFIPPGPRNPVGRVWIGLSLPGVGMHGTPNPELIGKTGSHGCFRLTNWDAIRLSKMVKLGTEVKFLQHPDMQIARN